MADREGNERKEKAALSIRSATASQLFPMPCRCPRHNFIQHFQVALLDLLPITRRVDTLLDQQEQAPAV